MTDQGDRYESHDFSIGLNSVVVDGGAPIQFSSLNSVSLVGGSLNDSFTVTPVFGNNSALVERTPTFNINGGAGTNSLVFNAEFEPVGTFPGGLAQNGVRIVSYSNISTIDLDNAAAVNAQADPASGSPPTAFAGLNANERFVQELYVETLGRVGARGELDSWTGLFNNPNSTQAADQAAIVSGIENSTEALDDVVGSWYVSYLGRTAANSEEAGWVNMLRKGETEEQVLSTFLS